MPNPKPGDMSYTGTDRASHPQVDHYEIHLELAESIVATLMVPDCVARLEDTSRSGVRLLITSAPEPNVERAVILARKTLDKRVKAKTAANDRKKNGFAAEEHLRAVEADLSAYQEAYWCLRAGEVPMVLRSGEESIELLGAHRASGGVVLAGSGVTRASVWCERAIATGLPYQIELARLIQRDQERACREPKTRREQPVETPSDRFMRQWARVGMPGAVEAIHADYSRAWVAAWGLAVTYNADVAAAILSAYCNGAARESLPFIRLALGDAERATIELPGEVMR